MAEEEKDLSLWQKSRGALGWGVVVILAMIVVVVAYDKAMNRIRQEVAAGIVLGVQTALQDSTTRVAIKATATDLLESREMRDGLQHAARPFMWAANYKLMYLAHMFNAFSRDVFGKEFKPMQQARTEADLYYGGETTVEGGTIKFKDYEFVPKKAAVAKKEEAPSEGEKKEAPAAEAPAKKKLTW